MTTIACDSKSMAGDGRVMCRGTIVGAQTEKVWRLRDGRLLGCAGRRVDGVAFRTYLEGGAKPKIKEAFEALVLGLNGRATYFCEHDLDGLDTELPAAIGSGMDYALGALDAGASPERAVLIASGRDTGTGGEVIHLLLERK